MHTPNPWRRRVLAGIAASPALALTPCIRTASAADAAASPIANAGPFNTALAVPGDSGWMGVLDMGEPVALAATAPAGGSGALAYSATRAGRQWRNPVLRAEQGTAVRVAFRNALAEPTIVHWHGLRVDSRNDGNGTLVAAPGAMFDYAFALANRSGTYWYHPHPHGLTAGQAQRGLYGVLLVSDADDRALTRALATRLAATDLPLVLHDQRSGAAGGYAADDNDRIHGYFGDDIRVNGAARPYFDVATRGYRLRVLNAANARTFRVAFRAADGNLLPFTLLGTDGGLLAAPRVVRELFVAAAERVDVWIDFSDRLPGDAVVMESLAFDPMHMEAAAAAPAAAAPPMAMNHAAHAMPAAAAPSSASPHAGHGGSAIGDGARLALMQFRVRTRVPASPSPPAMLSALAAATPGATQRPLRLSFAKGRWRINDRVFEMEGEPPIVVARNTTETWLFRNYYTSMPHAMHLHGFAMRVLARETSPDFITALAVDAQGRLPTDLGVKDTVLVWPGESVRVAVDFACDFPGDQLYVVHCHNLEHEDGGMMLRVKVV